MIVTAAQMTEDKESAFSCKLRILTEAHVGAITVDRARELLAALETDEPEPRPGVGRETSR